MPVSWLSGLNALTEPEEVKESKTESWASENISASVDLRVPWDERHEILVDILGNGVSWPYPNELATMFATGGGVRDMPGARTVKDAVGGHGLKSKYAILHIDYVSDAFDWTIGDDPGGGDGEVLVNETIEANGEFLTLPGSKFAWSSDAEPLTDEEAGGRLMLSYDYVIRWVGVQGNTIPDEFFEYISHTNSDSVTSVRLGRTFAPGQLLYNSPRLTNTVKRNGVGGTSDNIDLEARWSIRKDGWNKLWRAKTQAFDTYYWVDTDNPFDTTHYENYPPVAMAGMMP